MASISTTFSIRPVRREELEAWVDLANQSRYWQEDAAGTIFDDSLRAVEEAIKTGADVVIVPVDRVFE